MIREVKTDRYKIIKSCVLFFITSSLALSQYLMMYVNNDLEINFIAGTMANKNLLSSVLFLGLPFS